MTKIAAEYEQEITKLRALHQLRLDRACFVGRIGQLEAENAALRAQVAEAQARWAKRANDIDAWIVASGSRCKDEQRHCEEGTPERVYWHYGYMIALRDVLAYLQQEHCDA